MSDQNHKVTFLQYDDDPVRHDYGSDGDTAADDLAKLSNPNAVIVLVKESKGGVTSTQYLPVRHITYACHSVTEAEPAGK